MGSLRKLIGVVVRSQSGDIDVSSRNVESGAAEGSMNISPAGDLAPHVTGKVSGETKAEETMDTQGKGVYGAALVVVRIEREVGKEGKGCFALKMKHVDGLDNDFLRHCRSW